MTDQPGVVVVGGGPAAASVVMNLRRNGFGSAITIVSNEDSPPYERPPLSKGILTGDRSFDSLTILAPSWYADNGVDLLLDSAANRLDPNRRIVELDSGAVLRYSSLVLATGGSPRRLVIPGLAADELCYLRSLRDAAALRERLGPGHRLVIIGAGFIGGELAASARLLGAEVTLVEMLPIPLGRVVGEELGNLFADIHREHGVAVRAGVSVAAGTRVGGHFRLTMSDASTVECDSVAVGIGLLPNDELARAAGLACANGIRVDPFCRTSDPSIFAAGDVASHEHPLFGRTFRVEHHDNAIRQGAAVAANIMGSSEPYTDPHWFWSDQYENNLQGVGLVGNDHAETLTRGSISARRFTRMYIENGRLVGAISMNTGTEVKHVAKLISAGVTPPRADLADPSVDLKRLARTVGSAR